MNEHQKNKPAVEEDEIDLILLAKNLWDKRKFIIITILGFSILGVLAAFLSPVKYTASSTMVPQLNEGNPKMGNLSSLASMAGFNLNLTGEASQLSPRAYPKIAQSVPFQLRLMNIPLKFSDHKDSLSLYDYYTKHHSPGIISLVKKYTIGLPGLVLQSLKKEETASKTTLPGQKSGALELTEEQEKVRKIIEENIGVELNEQEGYLELKVGFYDPLVAAQVARHAQQLLQDYITRFKIEKASAQLTFIKERYNEKKQEFEKAQSSLAEFRDANKNVTSAIALTEQERLQNEYQLAFNVYSNLAQQLEEARIKVKEDTPVFSVIQPVTVPHEKSQPKRMLILVIWTFLGGIVAIGWVFAGQFLGSARERWHEIDEEQAGG